MQGFVPNAGGLLHSVNALEQLPNPVLFPGALKPGWLFHEHGFIWREDAVEESHFDVVLLKVPIEGSGEVSDSA